MPTCIFSFWTTHANGVPVKQGTNVHDLYHPRGWTSKTYAHNKTPVSYKRIADLFHKRVPVADQARERAKWFGKKYYTTKITVDRSVAEWMGYVTSMYAEDNEGEEEEVDSEEEEEEVAAGEEGEERKRQRLTPDHSIRVKMYKQEMHPGREDLEELNAAMINVLLPILIWGSDKVLAHVKTWDKTLYDRDQMWDRILPDQIRYLGVGNREINVLVLNYVTLKEMCAAIKTACFLACDVAVTILCAQVCNMICHENLGSLVKAIRGDAVTGGACAKRYLDYKLGKFRNPRIPIGMPPVRPIPLGKRALGFLRGQLATPQSDVPETADRNRMIRITGTRERGEMITRWRISTTGTGDAVHYRGSLAEALSELVRLKGPIYRTENGAFMVSYMQASLSTHAEIYKNLHLLDLHAMTILNLNDMEYEEGDPVQGDGLTREGWIQIFRAQPPNLVASLHFAYTIDFALLEYFPSLAVLSSRYCTHYRLPGDQGIMRRVADHPQEFVNYLNWVFQPGEISQNLRWPFLSALTAMPNPVVSQEGEEDGNMYLLNRYANNSEARRLWRLCQEFRVATATTPRAFDSMHDIPNAVEHIELSLYNPETGLWRNRAMVEQERLAAGT